MVDKALRKYGILALGILCSWPLNTLATSLPSAGVNALCAAVAIIWGLYACWAVRTNGKNALTGLCLSAGFVVGLIFVMKLPHQFSWHDLAGYNSDFSGEAKPDGHLGYIAYLVENGRLPMENPLIEGYSVFYNPPLHHILHALAMKFQLFLGISEYASLENLQLITLFFASGCMLITVDLMQFLKIGKQGVFCGSLFIAFQPSILIFGATINNDIQTTFLTLLCILFTIRWQRTRHIQDILFCGVSLGLAMATKLSSALIIPCIAVVFAVAFFRNLKLWKKYIFQFFVFLIVSVPEAIAWPLFHLIVYQMPLNYVRLPAETINVSHYTFWQRFGIPDSHAIRSLFYSGIRKVDHNVWMQTLKTGMFDEMTLFELGTPMWFFAYFTMVMFALLLLVALGLFIYWLLIRKSATDGMTKFFLSSYSIILITNYLNFCIQYPYICTFNFRYIMPVLPLCSIVYGFFSSRKRLLYLLPLCFSGMVLIVYGVYFFG